MMSWAPFVDDDIMLLGPSPWRLMEGAIEGGAGWPQIMLVFTESTLIAQYVYQIPSRLHCSAITPRVRSLAEEAGLHGNALRGVPIFCVYLATLMHTYSLARQKVCVFCVYHAALLLQDLLLYWYVQCHYTTRKKGYQRSLVATTVLGECFETSRQPKICTLACHVA